VTHLALDLPEARALDVRVRWTDTSALVDATGELDLATGDTLVAAVAQILAGGCERLVIGCRDLEFVDSGGLRALIKVRAACAHHDVDARLAEVGPQLQQLLRTCHLTRLFG